MELLLGLVLALGAGRDHPGPGHGRGPLLAGGDSQAAISLSQWDRTVSRLPPGPEDVAGALEAEGSDLELDLSLDALQAALSRFETRETPSRRS